MELIEALHAGRGIVCLVGAGGKKSALYRLAMAHPGRVGISATVHIPPPPKGLDAALVIADSAATVLDQIRLEPARRIGFFRPSGKAGRYAGFAPEEVAAIHRGAGFDVTLVKSDGARARLIKCPGADEPRLPEGADTVIPVVSIRALGQPLSERIAHRVAAITSVTGAEPGDILTVEHIARLLASQQAGLKGVGAATVVPLINMVDDIHLIASAREVARLALRMTRGFERVVLASMTARVPLVEVVVR